SFSLHLLASPQLAVAPPMPPKKIPSSLSTASPPAAGCGRNHAAGPLASFPVITWPMWKIHAASPPSWTKRSPIKTNRSRRVRPQLLRNKIHRRIFVVRPLHPEIAIAHETPLLFTLAPALLNRRRNGHDQDRR